MMLQDGERVVPHACPCGDLYFLFVLAALMSVQQSAATQLNNQPRSETSRSVTINRELILSHQLRCLYPKLRTVRFRGNPV